MAYPFGEIEKKWQKHWADNKTFRAENKSVKPKYYALDMFPYPSGAGLHVGHPLGYIASDIVSRYKRLKGFNVLHPMGYDSFGLPAEQYAIQTGQHPEKTTKDNIARYREQMDKIGFSFDWEREVRTSDPNYYKWTQWIFIKLFNSWYNHETDKAESINTLVQKLESGKVGKLEKKWDELNEKEKSDVLMEYRLAYLSEAWVNWCPQLGTVLANEEVKDGVSERGGYPVERKLMPQWSLRITAYANRLLNNLDNIDWSESIKEAQRNWIGKSEGASLTFNVDNEKQSYIPVFSTRPDTIFGATFLVLAPEHPLATKICSSEKKNEVDAYIEKVKIRSERDRMADVKNVTGVDTGAFCIHPFTKNRIPIWLGDYVLAGYGTGAVMAVPAHDSRDHAFAKHFDLEIKQVVSAPEGWDIQREAWDAKEGKCINSDFLNGLDVKDSIKRAIQEIEKRGLGFGRTQFRLRDAIFGRQRYWGEPIPVYYKDGIPHVMEENELPLVLPEVDKYLPTEDGEPPLARAKNWKHQGKYEYEKTTMPGWAGSSWYYLRYMDPQNKNEFAGKDALNYWKDVDLYIGGAEHATGHLLYMRFWTKFLFDLGLIPVIEPAKKLINQGMIQGMSAKIFIGGINSSGVSMSNNWMGPSLNNSDYPRQITFNDVQRFISSADVYPYKVPTGIEPFSVFERNSPIEFVDEEKLNIDLFIESQFGNEYSDSVFILKEGYYFKGGYYNDNGVLTPEKTRPPFLVKREVEKMSKSKYNVVTPDDICTNFGADTLRLYEMFLGPLEQSKPWNTNGISGVFGFLNKFWRLAHPNPPKGRENELKVLSNGEDLGGAFFVSEDEPTKPELKILHKTIKKIQQDIDNYSFNTSVSAFMICTNELTELKCNKRAILEPLVILLSSFAPHIAEELWYKLGNEKSITFATFPQYNEALMADDSYSYPISFNGKMRFNLELSLSLTPAEIEKEVLANEQSKKFLEGKQPKKVIVVPKRIVNIVM
ncbi:MAG: leucine--tRNA ligase [Bacteroidetes bacterium]|nr:leucine--tRNA ligase [Bacteroidota bacterium]